MAHQISSQINKTPDLNFQLPDEELKTRIVKSMSHVIGFIRTLPGTAAITYVIVSHSNQLFLLVYITSFQVCI